MTRFAVLVAALLWSANADVHATTSAEHATQLLAQAWMIENRCAALDQAEREQLTNFVARAEISLARKQSVKIAREAIASGRAMAASATCDENSAKKVRDILSAARIATAVTDLNKPHQTPETQVPPVSRLLPGAREPATKAEAAQITRTPEPEPRKIAAAPPQEKIPPAKRKTVGSSAAAKAKQPTVASSLRVIRAYAVTAETYYRERRCRNLPQKTLKSMYAGVLRQHRIAVSASNRKTVRRLLRAAEIRAARSAC